MDNLRLLLFITAITIPFFIVLIGFTLSVLGLALSPLAAFISRRMAQDRGMPPNRYTIAGALYSTLALFPWLYLIAYQYGKPAPNSIVRSCYIVLYAAWLLGPILGIGVLLMVEVGYSPTLEAPETAVYVEAPEIAMNVAVLVLMIIAWTISLTKLLVVDYVGSKMHPVFNWNYLLPVVFFLASSWAYIRAIGLGNPLVWLTLFR